VAQNTGKSALVAQNTGKTRQFHSDLPPFVPLVVEVLYDERLSSDAKMLWAFVQHMSWRQDGDPWNVIELSVREIETRLNLGVRPLRRATRELVDAGWLATKRRGLGQPNEYRVFSRLGAGARTRTSETHDQEEAETRVPRARASTGEKLDTKGQIEDPSQTLVVKGTSEAKGSTSASGPRAPATRKRDPVFDALADSTASDPHLNGGLIGKEAARLRTHPDYLAAVESVGKEAADAALALEIPIRAQAYRDYFGPDITLTVPALVKHWRLVGTAAKGELPRAESALDKHKRGLDDLLTKEEE
jgi:hypothetical protein